MFRRFVVMKERRQEAFEMATAQAYQTVLIYRASKGRKRMPEFKKFLGKSGDVLDTSSHPKKQRAQLEVLASRVGSRVIPMKRDRIVRGV